MANINPFATTEFGPDRFERRTRIVCPSCGREHEVQPRDIKLRGGLCSICRLKANQPSEPEPMSKPQFDIDSGDDTQRIIKLERDKAELEKDKAELEAKLQRIVDLLR